MNKRVVAKEWIIFISGFSFGALILPAFLTLIFDGSLRHLEAFYKELFDKKRFIIPLLVIFAPYLLIQIGRATNWSIKQIKDK